VVEKYGRKKDPIPIKIKINGIIILNFFLISFHQNGKKI